MKPNEKAQRRLNTLYREMVDNLFEWDLSRCDPHDEWATFPGAAKYYYPWYVLNDKFEPTPVFIT